MLSARVNLRQCLCFFPLSCHLAEGRSASRQSASDIRKYQKNCARTFSISPNSRRSDESLADSTGLPACQGLRISVLYHGGVEKLVRPPTQLCGVLHNMCTGDLNVHICTLSLSTWLWIYRLQIDRWIIIVWYICILYTHLSPSPLLLSLSLATFTVTLHFCVAARV